MPLRDRLSALRLAPGAAADADRVKDSRRGGRDRPRLAARARPALRPHQALWEPLAVAALNQPIAAAAAAPFVRVLSEMFGSTDPPRRSCIPANPLDEMYANRPARSSRPAAARSAPGALARVILGPMDPLASRSARVRQADRRRCPSRSTPQVIAAVPWHALRNLLPDPPRRARRARSPPPAAMASMPIVTVNLWYDRVVMDERLRRPDGTHDPVDLRQAPRLRRGRLAPVAGRQRRRSGGPDVPRRAGRDRRVREVAQTHCRAPARPPSSARPSSARRQATFSLSAGQPQRPRQSDAGAGPGARRRLDRHRAPGTIESAVVSGHRAAEEMLQVEGSG